MLKALADRLAESFAEHLHRRVRTEFWGYASDESLSNDELIREHHRGIRPAPGYPACSDHREKETLFRLLDVEKKIGVSLTEYGNDTDSLGVGLYLVTRMRVTLTSGKSRAISLRPMRTLVLRRQMSLAAGWRQCSSQSDTGLTIQIDTVLRAAVSSRMPVRGAC